MNCCLQSYQKVVTFPNEGEIRCVFDDSHNFSSDDVEHVDGIKSVVNFKQSVMNSRKYVYHTKDEADLNGVYDENKLNSKFYLELRPTIFGVGLFTKKDLPSGYVISKYQCVPDDLVHLCSNYHKNHYSYKLSSNGVKKVGIMVPVNGEGLASFVNSSRGLGCTNNSRLSSRGCDEYLVVKNDTMIKENCEIYFAYGCGFKF